MENLIVESFGKLDARNLNKYTSRVEKFLDKVKSGSEFELHTSQGKAVVDPDCDGVKALQRRLDTGELLPSSLKFRVKYSDGTVDEIPAGSFVKTPEFGGGGGAAGGSYQTKYFEAGQCVVNALGQKGNTSITEENRKNLKDLNCSLGKGLTIDKVWNFLVKVEDSEWIATLEQTARILNEKSNNSGWWHWQDGFVKSVSDAYSKFADKLPGTLDRWNPADIWFTATNTDDISSLLDLSSIESCIDFTEQMDKLYEEGKVVGVSLKKKEETEIQGKRRFPKEAKIEVSDVQVEKIGENSCTLNINFTEDEKNYTLQIRKGDSFKLRCHVKKAGKSSHFDGGCTQPVLDYCLQTCLHLSEEETSMCSPEYYRKEVANLEESYVLDHPFLFDEELVQEAEERVQGIYPLDQEYPSILVQEGAVSANRVASRKALDYIYSVLVQKSQEEVTEFVTLLTKYCWSMVFESARHYKVY